jgi:hypothetical protein
VKNEREALKGTLAQHGEDRDAEAIRQALDGSDSDLLSFLASNVRYGLDPESGWRRAGRLVRRQTEEALVKLGARQIQEGVVNGRTGMWVDVFSK